MQCYGLLCENIHVVLLFLLVIFVSFHFSFLLTTSFQFLLALLSSLFIHTLLISQNISLSLLFFLFWYSFVLIFFSLISAVLASALLRLSHSILSQFLYFCSFFRSFLIPLSSLFLSSYSLFVLLNFLVWSFIKLFICNITFVFIFR